METIYGGLDNEFSNYEKAAIAVLPVPYDGTSTWIKGADKGPEALLEASANMELYDATAAADTPRRQGADGRKRAGRRRYMGASQERPVIPASHAYAFSRKI